MMWERLSKGEDLAHILTLSLLKMTRAETPAEKSKKHGQG